MKAGTIDVESRETWERAKKTYLSTLRSQDEVEQAERHFSMITSVAIKDGSFVVYTKNEFAADLLKREYEMPLTSCLTLVNGGKQSKLTFKCDASVKTSIIIPTVTEARPITATQPTKKEFVSTLPLNSDYTFEEFVRGPSNSFALSAAEGVVKNPGGPGLNPLFIHGGTGLGKTHLMQAIGNELRRKNPSLAICYLTAETFLNEYVIALQNGQREIDAFRQRYRSLDILLIDDVQFLQKGKNVQEEFFNTFNALKDNHHQIVMTSDVAPKNLPSIEDRLISRFEGGMVQEIESPSYETRLAILKKKAESYDVKIPDKAMEFIADNIKSHVRAMEGALGKVMVYLNACPSTELTNDVLGRLLGDFIEKEQTLRKLSVDEIQATVAKKYGVTMAQLLSPERTQSIVTPRQLAMYIARKYTTKSLPEIAKMFEKTHATIIHGVKSIEKRMDVEADLKATLAEILAELGYKMSDKMD